ncbi:ATP-binding cassette sub- A member 3 [Chytriomyces hyalinus]|nr:ATP-binding cassette sub- A member 3 [Chytriomyces hyalinus]
MSAIPALLLKNLRIKRRRFFPELWTSTLVPFLVTFLVAQFVVQGGFSATHKSQDDVYDPTNLGLYFPAGLPYGKLVVADLSLRKVSLDAFIGNLRFPTGVKAADAVVKLSSKKEIVDYCAASKNACVGAVVFTDSPSVGDSSSTSQWKYTLMVDTDEVAKKRDRDEGAPTTDRVLPYLQKAVDRAIMLTYPSITSAEINDQKSSIRTFSSQTVKIAQLQSLIRTWGSAMYLTLFGGIIYNYLQGTALEKESRLKESMLMMGLTNIEYTASWFLTSFIQCFAAWVGFAAVFRAIALTDVPYTQLVGFSLLTGFSALCFAHVLSAFLSNARTGPGIGLVIVLVIVVAFTVILNKISFGVLGLSVLAFFLAPAAWWVGLTGMAQSMLPSNLVEDKVAGISFTSACILTAAQCVFYICLGWYLSEVVPQPWGSPRSPFFLFQLSYWRPKSSTLRNGYVSMENQDLISEPLPRGASEDIGISFRNLTKTFKHPITGAVQTAVGNFTMDIQKGSVLGLLGRNGAGKTTIISMLTGLLPCTSGDAIVEGASILTGGARKRGVLGVCPQLDTIFPTLTVFETLQLFARIKRVPLRELSNQINSILESTGLTEKRNELAANLSGGQKRRMLVAVAFIGDSRIVILDEMSSGVDPVSRRALWEVVNKNKAGRTIILTTHFLDEAEALSDRIAIIADGKLKCVGSSMFLKNKFGAGYNLNIMLKNTIVNQQILDKITSTVQKHAPDAEVVSSAGSEIQFHLSEEHASQFSSLIKQLEMLPQIETFGLSVTTLDEVFMRANLHDDLSSLGSPGAVTAAPKSVENIQLRAGSSIGRPSFFSQTAIMVQKTAKAAMRDRFVFGCRILLPILAAVLSAYIMREDNSFETCSFVKADESPQLVSLFSRGLYVYPQSLVDPVSSLLDGKAKVTGLADIGAREAFINTFKSGIIPPLLSAESPLSTTVILSSVAGDDQLAVALQSVATNLFLQTKLQRGPGLLVNASIEYLPGPPTIDWNFQPLDQVYMLLAMLMFCLPGLLGSKSLIAERVSGAKYQQYVSGLRIPSYWFGQAIFDGLLVLVVCLVCTSVFFIAKTPNMTGNFVWLFASFTAYGWASLSMGYIRSFSAVTVSSSLTSILAFYFAVGFYMYFTFLVQAVILPNELPSGSSIVTIVGIVMTVLCPPVGLFWSHFIYTNALNFRCSSIAEVTQLLSISQGIWKPITAMFGQSVLFFVITLLLDVFDKNPGGNVRQTLKRRGCFRFRSKKNAPKEFTAIAREYHDEDVIKEARTLKVPVVGDGALVLQHVNKKYGTNEAVKKLSLTVEKGTCFALLGSNGCGKSSTFDMICGKKKPTAGSAFVNGYNVLTHIHSVHQHMGYCPQFDALQENLSVKETITLYGQIKGIPRSQLPSIVENLMACLDLTPHQDKYIMHLSGGNKRKTSAAVALIGTPPVILLDEPSTGMDALSKRRMWDVITSLRENHAVVLTTHSMEEAESVSNRMAIMSHGQLRCIGTMHHLRKKFASDYEIDLVLVDSRTDVRNLGLAVKEVAVSPIDLCKVRLKVENIVHARGSNLAELFDQCEALKRGGWIVEYRISPASLEQIFMDVIKEAELSREMSSFIPS